MAVGVKGIDSVVSGKAVGVVSVPHEAATAKMISIIPARERGVWIQINSGGRVGDDALPPPYRDHQVT